MQIAVTVVKTQQISMDEYKDFYTTKVFSECSTIIEIITWAKTIDKNACINSIKISKVEI